jgi:transcriptional regulator with XRE-family HTH domain
MTIDAHDWHGPDGPADPDDLTGVLSAVGPRLRALRRDAGLTLAQLAETTGISVSTLSRLESGRRRPTLELLLPLARAHQVPLDELVGAPAVGDPRIDAQPFTRHGMTFVPLSRHAGGLQAYKQTIPTGFGAGDLDLKMHSRVSSASCSATGSWSSPRARLPSSTPGRRTPGATPARPPSRC